MAEATAPARLRASDTRQEPRGGPALMGEVPILLRGDRQRTGHTFEVRSPYDGAVIAHVHRAGPHEIEAAIAAAAAAFETTRRLPSWKRSAVLENMSAAIAARREELAAIVAREAGKPIKTARLEVDRAAFVFKVASEEARFASIFIKRSIMPDTGATHLLPAQVGPGIAAELTLTGNIYDAKWALEKGLVNKVVPHDKLMEESMAVAETSKAVTR